MATMAEDGANNDQQRIEDKIRLNKERIEYIKQELKKSNDERFKDLEGRNDALEKEIKELKSENQSLAKQLQEMEDDNVSMKQEIAILTTDNKGHKAREEYEKNVMRITQIGTSIQRNMCQYVLGEHFNENYFYRVRQMEPYIKYIKDTKERFEASRRWSGLKVKIGWDQRLVYSLKTLNTKRNGIAHPKLTEAIIQDASDCLEKEGTLDEGMVNNINKLKEMWKKSEYLLRKPDSEPEPDKANQEQRSEDVNSDLGVSRQHDTEVEDKHCPTNLMTMTDSGIFDDNYNIEDLKEKLRIRKNKEKELEQELQQCKSEHERYNKEIIEELKDGNEVREEKIVQLEQEIEKNKEVIENLRQKLHDKYAEIYSMKRKMELIEEERKEDGKLFDEANTKFKRTEEENKDFRKKFKQLESRNIVCIGQLCENVQRNMYKYVFPRDFNKHKSYTVTDIKDDIDQLKNVIEKREARRTFDDLKQKIKLGPGLEQVMKTFKEQRNKEVHRDLEQREIEMLALGLEGSRKYQVQRIIQLWKNVRDISCGRRG